MKNSIILILIIVFVCAGGYYFVQKETGKTYKTLAALEAAQEKKGYVPLGNFGSTWPAKITEIKKAENEINFSLKSGARHGYPGYDGYTLKVIRLNNSQGEETVAVFRSKEKM